MLVNHSVGRCTRNRAGTAAVEFALIAPLLVLILGGIWELGRVVEVQQITTNAAREGGRLACGGAPDDELVTQVRIYLKNSGLSASVADNATVTLDKTYKTAQLLNGYKVSVGVRVADVCWVPIYVVTGPNATLNGEAVWVRD